MVCLLILIAPLLIRVSSVRAGGLRGSSSPPAALGLQGAEQLVEVVVAEALS